MHDHHPSSSSPVVERPFSGPYGVALAVACLLGVLVYFGSAGFSGSIDMGWHYTLQRYFQDGLQFGEWSDRGLGPMDDYPPLAHLIAGALAAWLPIPSLIAMNIVAVAGVFAAYVGAMYLVPKESRVAAGFMAATIFYAFGSFGYRDFSGAELFGNFFFAQVVGDGLMVVAAAVVAHFRRRVSLSILAPVAAIVIGSFFNLSAVKFVIFLAVLQLIVYVVETDWSPSSFVRSYVPVALAGLATVLHPNFLGMVSNANHNGGTDLTGVELGLTAVGAFVAGALLVTVSMKRDANRFAMALGALSFALAGAMTLQALALWLFEMGSYYAIAKHGILTGTIGVIAFAALISLPARKFPDEFGSTAFFPVIFTAIALSPAAAASVMPSVLYMDDLRSFVDRHPEIVDNSISYASDVSPQTNFAAALGELGMGGWTPESYEQLGRFHIVTGYEDLAEFATVSPGQTGVMDPSCLIAEGAVSRLVRSQCLPDD